MADEQTPQAWVGQDVVVYGLAQYPIYARLEGIGEFGVVLRQQTYVSWPTGETAEWGGEAQEGEDRLVPNFYPWHQISGFRLQEEEEKRAYGLE